MSRIGHRVAGWLTEIQRSAWVTLFSAMLATALLALWPWAWVGMVAAVLLAALGTVVALSSFVLMRWLSLRAYQRGTDGARTILQRSAAAAVAWFLAWQALSATLGLGIAAAGFFALGTTFAGIIATVAGLALASLALVSATSVDRTPLAVLTGLRRVPLPAVTPAGAGFAFDHRQQVRAAHREEIRDAARSGHTARSALLVTAMDDPPEGVAIRLPDLAAMPGFDVVHALHVIARGATAHLINVLVAGVALALVMHVAIGAGKFDGWRSQLADLGRVAPPQDPSTAEAQPPPSGPDTGEPNGRNDGNHRGSQSADGASPEGSGSSETGSRGQHGGGQGTPSQSPTAGSSGSAGNGKGADGSPGTGNAAGNGAQASNALSAPGQSSTGGGQGTSGQSRSGHGEARQPGQPSGPDTGNGAQAATAPPGPGQPNAGSGQGAGRQANAGQGGAMQPSQASSQQPGSKNASPQGAAPQSGQASNGQPQPTGVQPNPPQASGAGSTTASKKGDGVPGNETSGSTGQGSDSTTRQSGGPGKEPGLVIRIVPGTAPVGSPTITVPAPGPIENGKPAAGIALPDSPSSPADESAEDGVVIRRPAELLGAAGGAAPVAILPALPDTGAVRQPPPPRPYLPQQPLPAWIQAMIGSAASRPPAGN